MVRSAKKSPPRHGGGGKTLVPSTLTLALLRLRKTWGLLLITGAGFVAAVMLACAVPLYSNVSMTAGLRGALTSSAQNSDIIVNSTSEQINPGKINLATQELNTELQDKIGPYLEPPQFSIQTPVLPIVTKLSSPKGGIAYPETNNQLQFFGASIEQAASHLSLIKGRLPGTNSSSSPGSDVEIALSQESASSLKVTIGSVLNIKVALVYIPVIRKEYIIHLRIVGIFNVANNDAYWHGNDFLSVARGSGPLGQKGRIYTGLVSNETIISVISALSPSTGLGGLVLEIPFDLLWYYRFDASRISIDNLNDILNGTNTVQVDVSNLSDLDQPPFLEMTQAYLPTNILSQYSSRIAVAQLPVTSLLCLVLGLVLFFVSMMADLLVDRQSDAIAILRSRGASRRQIFGSLVTQSVALGLIALLVGPLLAIAAVRLIAQNVLSPADQSALSLVSGNALQVALGVGWYALLTVVVAIIAMVIAVSRTTRQDVLSMRREAARSTRLPLWQRLNLDIVAAIVMIVGYGFSAYVINEGILDPQLTLFLLSPLTLVGSVFLLLACLLLFLRFFPYLLQLGSWLTARSRSAAPMLALAQMARTPRQSVRMTLLLALATAFAIFTLIFTASQGQRILDVSAYQSGADFSGTIPNSTFTRLQVKEITTLYHHIPGVLSATVGNTSSATSANTTLDISIALRAVDADTFAQSAIWTPQDSSQPLSSLMGQLAARRASAISGQLVPAVVDTATWNALNLASGPNFTLNFTDGNVAFIAIAEVPHIPTVSSGSVTNSNGGSTTTGGILVDYSSYAAIYEKDFQANGVNVPLNAVWLRTRDDAASLTRVRKALNAGELQLGSLYDRRAITDALYHEPLYLDLIGVLALGATVALLLALVGNLIASWLSARSRLANFAVLRALGAAPPQIASTLTWEQCIIYTTSIMLGILFGAILSALVVPVLVFTSVGSSGVTSDTSSGAFYVAQSVPPIQVIIPPSLGIALAVLVVICVVALGMMVRIVSQPSISQTLRLNED